MAGRRYRRRLRQNHQPQQRQSLERLRKFHVGWRPDHPMDLFSGFYAQRRMANHRRPVNHRQPPKPMNLHLRFIAVALALAPCAGQATISFQNNGTTNGWTTLWHEDGQGFEADVNSPSFQGSTAIQCRTVFRSTYGGRYHTECRKGGQATMGMDRYYGFSFYLPPNWQFVDQSFNIQQFIGNASGCSGGQPITMTHLQNHALITRIVTGPDGCTRSHQYFTVTTNVTAGAWHR